MKELGQKLVVPPSLGRPASPTLVYGADKQTLCHLESQRNYQRIENATKPRSGDVKFWDKRLCNTCRVHPSYSYAISVHNSMLKVDMFPA